MCRIVLIASEDTLEMLKLGALQPLLKVLETSNDSMLTLALGLFANFAADGMP